MSLPTWKANVGYEEGEEWVLSKMKTGYPRQVYRSESFGTADKERFFIHKSIQAFALIIVDKYGKEGEQAILFPSHAIASRCLEFFNKLAPELNEQQVRILDLLPSSAKERSEEYSIISPKISAVIFPTDKFSIAKQYWQHSGDGISSRRAEYCHNLFSKGLLIDATTITSEDMSRFRKGPRRYQQKPSVDITPNGTSEDQDFNQFVEQRFGRNLDLSMARNAKLACRRRIAGHLTADVELSDALRLEKDLTRTRHVAGFSEDDVYLFPCGMNAIFISHRIALALKGTLRSVVYG